MARWTAEWKELSFEKKLALVGAPLLVAVVVGLVISPLSTLLSDRTTSRLEVVDLAVLDSPAGGEERQHVPPQVEVAVGERVPVDVRQEIRAGEADRFAFELTVPEEWINDYAVHLYRLGVRLERDGGRALDAGMAVVSVPRAVDRWYFDEDAAAYGEDVAACYAQRGDLRALRPARRDAVREHDAPSMTTAPRTGSWSPAVCTTHGYVAPRVWSFATREAPIRGGSSAPLPQWGPSVRIEVGLRPPTEWAECGAGHTTVVVFADRCSDGDIARD